MQLYHRVRNKTLGTNKISYNPFAMCWKWSIHVNEGNEQISREGKRKKKKEKLSTNSQDKRSRFCRVVLGRPVSDGD